MRHAGDAMQVLTGHLLLTTPVKATLRQSMTLKFH
jgi:hypothetical protein